MNRILTALALLTLAGSANAQQALTPQWDASAQHEREVARQRDHDRHLGRAATPQEHDLELLKMRVDELEDHQRELRLCMVDLATITDPELRKWCEAQSKKLP